MPNLDAIRRRHVLIALAAAPALIHCGGGSESSPVSADTATPPPTPPVVTPPDTPTTPPVLGKKVFVATPNATTIVLSETQGDTTEALHVSTSSPGQPRITSYYATTQGTVRRLIFDELGRPITFTQSAMREQVRIFHPQENAILIAVSDSTGTFLAGFAIWKSGEKYLAGFTSSESAQFPQDITAVKDVTDSVVMATKSSQSSKRYQPGLATKLLAWLPISSAQATIIDDIYSGLDRSEDVVRKFIAAVAPPLAGLVAGMATLDAAVAIGGLGTALPIILATAATLFAFIFVTSLVLDRARANGLDYSNATQITAEYFKLPFVGAFNVIGPFESNAGPIPETVDPSNWRNCNGTLSVAGSLIVAVGPSSGTATITGTEIFSGSCFRSRFPKRNVIELARTGNKLFGKGDSLFGRGWILDLTLSSDESSINGTIQYPYAFDIIKGDARGNVTLFR